MESGPLPLQGLAWSLGEKMEQENNEIKQKTWRPVTSHEWNTLLQPHKVSVRLSLFWKLWFHRASISRKNKPFYSSN